MAHRRGIPVAIICRAIVGRAQPYRSASGRVYMRPDLRYLVNALVPAAPVQISKLMTRVQSPSAALQPLSEPVPFESAAHQVPIGSAPSFQTSILHRHSTVEQST